MDLESVAKAARAASHVIGGATSEQKNKALSCIHADLIANRAKVLSENALDKEDAAKHNIDQALQKRLDLEKKYDSMLQGLKQVENDIVDPVGVLSLATELDEGLNLYRIGCPIGVICIVFESRPEAAVQIASLCIKSGNSLILKGGKEAKRSNQVLAESFQRGLAAADLPATTIQLVSSRDELNQLLQLESYIDLVIPRGSNALVKHVMQSTNIPVLGHADGICSIYIDANATDEDKAIRTTVDSKTQYTAVCNAAETLIIHKDVVSSLWPKIAKALTEKGVKLNCDEQCLEALKQSDPATQYNTTLATEEDYRKEYLDLEMTVICLDSIEDAIAHINNYGSHHTDCIITEDGGAAEKFLRNVDSAGVFHNASTRFADGFRYGFGAEIGVSTNRIHARGPVGLEGLVIYKYRLHGDGHCVAPYASGEKQFKHNAIQYTQGDHAPCLDK